MISQGEWFNLHFIQVLNLRLSQPIFEAASATTHGIITFFRLIAETVSITSSRQGTLIDADQARRLLLHGREAYTMIIGCLEGLRLQPVAGMTARLGFIELEEMGDRAIRMSISTSNASTTSS